MAGNQNYINHVALVLDASISMAHLSRKVIEVADQQITYLARRSQELDQETRVTVYVFDDEVQCVVYDKDVLRMPSIATLYRPRGNTALLAATLKSQAELAETAQRYGDHSFLTFVLTDGQENSSHRAEGYRHLMQHQLRAEVAQMIQTQDDNWTLAVLVPDQMGKREAMQCGFPKDNIAIWDATSTRGMEEAGEVIKQATENFMQARTRGIRGTKSVFSNGAEAVNAKTIQSAGLKAVDPKSFMLVHATNDGVMRNPAIREWVMNEAGHTYRTGMAYYELTKSEKIQPQKSVMVMDKKTKKVYGGEEARNLLGLPDMEVRVKPDFNPDFKIFVQSTSTNRKLVGNTQVLLMTR